MCPSLIRDTSMLPVDLDLVLHRPDLNGKVSRMDVCGITVLAQPIPMVTYLHLEVAFLEAQSYFCMVSNNIVLNNHNQHSS